MKKELKVIYDNRSTEGNRLLDKAIRDALHPFGYRQWASGFNFTCDKRDLAFEMDDKIKQAQKET